MAKWNENHDYTKDIVEKKAEVPSAEVKQTLQKSPIIVESSSFPVKTPVNPHAIKQTTFDDYSFDNLSILSQNLGNCLKIIDDEVMKGYLSNLDRLPIIEADKETLNNLKPIHFFRITELVYQEEELSLHKLSTLFRVLCDKPCTLVLMIKSDGQTNEFFLGARSRSDINSTATMVQTLKQSLVGLFPGSRVEDYYDENLRKDMQTMNFDCLSGVTCVADFRQKIDNINDKQYIQGMEKFVESMRGRSYQAFFIADNVGRQELMRVKRNYESISTQISPFANMQMNFSLSDSKSTAKGRSDGKTSGTSYTRGTGVTRGSSESLTHTEGSSESYGKTTTRGTSQNVADGNTTTLGETYGINASESDAHTEGSSKTAGAFAGVNASYSRNNSDTHTTSKGWSHSNSSSNSISRTLSHGINESHSDSKGYGTNKSDGTSQTVSRGTTENESHSDSETINFMESLTLTDTLGTSQGITLNAKNATFASIIERLDKQLKRIEECESFGMWNFAAYFVGESPAETESAANIYQSVVSGADSGIECSAINTWQNGEALAKLSPYIKNFLHPLFSYQGFDYDEARYETVSPAALVSTNELSIHMGLPYTSVKGLPVVNHAAFAQEILRKDSSADKIKLGNVYHMGDVQKTQVNLDCQNLTSHTFITGSTGSGKSNAIYQILSEIKKRGVSFLVIEPAKGEYKQAFQNVKCLGTNPNLGDIIKINPFAFQPTIHVLEHIDRLIEIFNVCWPMYAAMPAVLKDAVERAYKKSGWDLERSVNSYSNELFPTFADVMDCVKEVLAESDYSADNKGDYVGSLVTRLRSLTNGINGLIFTADEISEKELFNEDTIVDLSRVGSAETKSLIMGLLVLKLQEYRMEERMRGVNANTKLRHVTVLEEAHNLLKRTSTEQSSESANLLGKSVEMLENAIAEMRTYGEGFIIADQSPGLLDMSVIRNTNTKIILRLPDFSDRELVGKAAGLSNAQINELIKLERGVAAVSQIDWLEPVLCNIDLHNVAYESNNFSVVQVLEELPAQNLQDVLLDCVMNYGVIRGDNDFLENLKQRTIKSKLPTIVKCAFLEYLKTREVSSLKKFAYEFLDAKSAIKPAKDCKDINVWVDKVLKNLPITVENYSQKQIDILMAMLIYEQAERDSSYENVLKKFTEVHKEKGAVYQ